MNATAGDTRAKTSPAVSDCDDATATGACVGVGVAVGVAVGVGVGVGDGDGEGVGSGVGVGDGAGVGMGVGSVAATPVAVGRGEESARSTSLSGTRTMKSIRNNMLIPKVNKGFRAGFCLTRQTINQTRLPEKSPANSNTLNVSKPSTIPSLIAIPRANKNTPTPISPSAPRDGLLITKATNHHKSPPKASKKPNRLTALLKDSITKSS